MLSYVSAAFGDQARSTSNRPDPGFDTVQEPNELGITWGLWRTRAFDLGISLLNSLFEPITLISPYCGVIRPKFKFMSPFQRKEDRNVGLGTLPRNRL